MKVICVKKNIMSPITVGKIYDKDLMPLEQWRDQQLNTLLDNE
jgi:hypothetical protein